MSRTKQASNRNRLSKIGPVLGAAGLSLSLASRASLAITAPALDTLTSNAGVSHEITLREEEIFDVSLATFHVFDKESHAGERLACGCGGGCCLFARAPSSAFGSDAYPPRPRAMRPAHKQIRKQP
jgi:hypothetical protein